MMGRALITFLLAIILVRLAGRRAFGLRSPFDTVISLLLGATLRRGIVGASSFTGTLGACLALVILHRVLAYVCLHSDLLSRLVSGNDKVLYENGQLHRSNMRRMLVSEQDLKEAVRRMSNEATLSDIERAFIERNGEISIVKKKISKTKRAYV
ncbi:hypothetical protein CWM47_08290 [Spirosoma pollinicola]|uniref:YetF C-terminal domain-containing protein n=2 Tax=Spirosoma pollinicola TaxID=2057025 RepID=A0A2K8ZBG3_9BACT|nr:hypothetical protein CWM47_08290 [Spirosoma pollinicola]